MMHAHRCGTCGRTWQHDPDTWPEKPNPRPTAAYYVRHIDEHTCCREMWPDHWPPRWPLHLLGARFHRAFQRNLRATLRALAFVSAALVQLGQPARQQGRS